jgi:hypothetical protein
MFSIVHLNVLQDLLVLRHPILDYSDQFVTVVKLFVVLGVETLNAEVYQVFFDELQLSAVLCD